MVDEKAQVFGEVLDLRAANVRQRGRFDFAFTGGVSARLPCQAVGHVNCTGPLTSLSTRGLYAIDELKRVSRLEQLHIVGIDPGIREIVVARPSLLLLLLLVWGGGGVQMTAGQQNVPHNTGDECVQCPVCLQTGSEQRACLKPIRKHDDCGSGTQKVFCNRSIYECPGVGFFFTHPTLSASEIASLYSKPVAAGGYIPRAQTNQARSRAGKKNVCHIVYVDQHLDEFVDCRDHRRAFASKMGQDERDDVARFWNDRVRVIGTPLRKRDETRQLDDNEHGVAMRQRRYHFADRCVCFKRRT